MRIAVIGTYHLTKSKVSYIIEKQLINHSRNLNKIFLIAPLRYAREVKRIKSAKEQECRVLISPRRTTTYNPKTNNVVVVIEVDVVAKSRTAILRIVEPRTTAQQLAINA